MNFQAIQNQSSIFKALAHPTRLAIVKKLSQEKKCVGDIMKELDLGQSNVSQHLSVLRKYGLVRPNKEGLWVKYSLTTNQVINLINEAEKIYKERPRQPDLSLTQNDSPNI